MDYTKFFAKKVARRRENLIRKFAEMQSTHAEHITFAGGMPNPATFPIKAMSITYRDDILKKLTGLDLNASLQYGPSQGHHPLLRTYREFQERCHKPLVKDLDVIFMPGSQEGFCKILDLLMNEGEPIMMQVPTYTATLGAVSVERISKGYLAHGPTQFLGGLGGGHLLLFSPLDPMS